MVVCRPYSWLGDPARDPVHLRTPDYVLYSPKPGASETTSDYTIKRDMSNYTLDLADNNLKARETYVLGQIMGHIASWDAAHGSKHTVIGVQLGNEVTGRKGDFPVSLIISYMSDVGSAVKNSAYVVWTRMNCISWQTNSRINANESLRASKGTNVDFVGIDVYGGGASTMRTVLPYRGGNYRMIMESGAENSRAAQFQLAALSGNNAYDHYDMLGPDGHGLYDRDGDKGFKPHGAYINDVRTVNKLLNSANVDLALNAQGYGLFVHNWAGDSTAATTGVEGIVFKPASATSQGISIRRSNTELVLMNTRGGTFTYPASLRITGATKGYFDSNDVWVNQGNVPFTSTSISPSVGITVRLTRPDAGGVTGLTRQAEFAEFGGGAVVESTNLSFAGNGYLRLPGSGGYAQWSQVEGKSGGDRTIRLRYSNGRSTPWRVRLLINGVAQNLTLPPTDAWGKYSLLRVTTPLKSGTANTIRVESVEGAGYIDELHLWEANIQSEAIPPGNTPVRMVLIGDSTVSPYPATRPDRGWGQFIEERFKDGAATVINLAVPGRSTKSFLQEGRWRKALEEKPNYVLIQFGHNDSHDPNNPESTDAVTDYKEYLCRYIDESRAIGATPILVTPMVRRTFDADGKITNSPPPNRPLVSYANAMKEVGSEKKVAVIDLYSSSKALAEMLGPEASAEFANKKGDITHFNEKGARAMADLVMRELLTAEPKLKEYLKAP